MTSSASRQPPRLATSAAFGVLGVLLLLGAACSLSASPLPRWLRPEPSLAGLPQGPVLERATRRGTLVVGVRSYPRPAPPGAPAPAEPDSYDAAIAGRLAAQLGLQVELVGLAPSAQDGALREGRVDLVLAGAPADAAAGSGIATVQGSYDQASGMLVALRKGRAQEAADLRDAPVCVAQGSGYASTVAQRFGARPRSYPSSVHAASAFMAGECQALAEDSEVLDRLLGNEEWRFYKALARGLAPEADATIRLAEGDAASREFLSAALRTWRVDGTLQQARTARAGNLQFEIGLLQDGLVCHS